MATPIRIRFQGVVPSPELTRSIEQAARALSLSPAALADWQIAVQRWHHHHAQGAYYRVEIEITLAHKAIKIARESALNAPREQLGALIEGAFASDEHSLQMLASDANAGRHVLLHSAEERRLHALHGSV
jgi:hypothetical protein